MTEISAKVYRFRVGDKGRWGTWCYSARLDPEAAKKHTIEIRTQWRLGEQRSIDGLAQSLSKIPSVFALDLRLVKTYGEFDEPGCVSLCYANGANNLTQWAEISDTELGELGVLVQHYAMLEKKRAENDR